MFYFGKCFRVFCFFIFFSLTPPAHYSVWNAAPLSFAIDSLQIVLRHYPSRLFRCYIIDAPWAFRSLWKVLSNFLDEVSYQEKKTLKSFG